MCLLENSLSFILNDTVKFQTKKWADGGWTKTDFHTRLSLPFPVYVLRERDPDALGRLLGVEFSGALPVTLLYDARGRLLRHWEEAVSEAELDSAIEAAK
mgnify:CR=1 FL=1